MRSEAEIRITICRHQIIIYDYEREETQRYHEIESHKQIVDTLKWVLRDTE